MDDQLLCESLLAWACCGDYHLDSADRNGAFICRNPYRLDAYAFSQLHERRGALLNAWISTVMRRHRAQLAEVAR
jgi:hypothetical protein